MKTRTFLDTSGWFAALNRKDPAHARVHPEYRRLTQHLHRGLTSNLVVAEMHALFLKRLGRDAGLRFLDSAYAERTHEVRFVDAELERAAIDRWARPFRDQEFTLTDAVSFEIMHREGIRTAFALDRRFAAAGFDLLPS